MPWPIVGFLGAGVSPGELLIVFAAVLILFGPRKLPQIARTAGRIFEEIRRASQEFRDQVMNLDRENSNLPSANPHAENAASPDEAGEGATAESSPEVEHVQGSDEPGPKSPAG